MENTIILKSGQKVEVLLQDEVSLDIDCSLRYIKSGQKEISDYVSDTIKPQLNNIVLQAQTGMEQQIENGIELAKNAASLSAQNTISSSIDAAESEIASYVTTNIKPDMETAAAQAAASAGSAAESKEQAAQYVGQISAKVENFNLSSDAKMAELENLSDSASANALNARNWAIGNIDEAPEGSSKYWASVSKETAQTVIGDIGIAPFGIDETKNLRRYLNGQVISQSQFQTFTTKLKNAVALYPNLATTETDWQAEVTNSKLGQCGKFVINNTAGTIRLPKVVNLNGLHNLSMLGSIKAESLPNITGKAKITDDSGDLTSVSGAFYNMTISSASGNSIDTTPDSSTKALGLDASKSSSAYQDNAPVQQEAIQYPYFIQVAGGNEESIDVSTEIQLNNPFSLLDYKWSEYELSNASWLLSNGQFNSGTTYTSIYQLLLAIKNGTETKAGVSVKLSTQTYTDYDFVINTTDTTFRLPVKVKLASGSAVIGNGMTLGLTNGTNNAGLINGSSTGLNLYKGSYGSDIGNTGGSANAQASNQTYGITTDSSKSGIETSSNGLKLYFYAGETIQDANIIATSGALTKLANCIDRTSETDRETVISWGMPDYSAGISIASSLPYTAPCAGVVFGVVPFQGGTRSLTVNGIQSGYGYSGNSAHSCFYAFPSKGDIVNVDGSIIDLVFFPLKGVI